MIDCIKDLVQNKHWKNAGKVAILEDEKSKMKVTVTVSSKNGLSFAIPENGEAHPVMLKSNKNYKQSCDYFIFTARGSVIDVYFVEMKESLPYATSNNQGVSRACDQILHTVPVLDYLVSMVQTHCQKSPKIKKHFAIIAKREDRKLNKQRVKPRGPIKHCYRGEQFKIIYSLSNIPLSHLR